MNTSYKIIIEVGEDDLSSSHFTDSNNTEVDWENIPVEYQIKLVNSLDCFQQLFARSIRYENQTTKENPEEST